MLYSTLITIPLLSLDIVIPIIIQPIPSLLEVRYGTQENVFIFVVLPQTYLKTVRFSLIEPILLFMSGIQILHDKDLVNTVHVVIQADRERVLVESGTV